MRRAVAVASAFFAAALAWCLWAAQAAEERDSANERDVEALAPYARDHEREPYVVNYQKDMQLPELPTGCEATALSTLMRMHGVEASKIDVANAMPKSDRDYVRAFLGDPERSDGWCCMAPCSAATAALFLPPVLAAVDATGTPLDLVPTPFCAWVSIDLEALVPTGKELEGYKLFQNPHCVTVTKVTDTEVECIDPLRGMTVYERPRFEGVFVSAGSQSVYIERN